MSLVDWLIAPRLQRILGALLVRPEQSYSISELIRVGGVGSRGGQMAIADLVAAGVVIEERVGNQRRLRANADFPLFPEIRAICAKSFGVSDRVRQALEPFAASLARAFIFGSVATGADKANSDIDLMLIGEVEDYIALTDALHGVEEAVKRPVHFHLYGLDEWENLMATDAVIRQIADGPKIEVLHGPQ